MKIYILLFSILLGCMTFTSCDKPNIDNDSFSSEYFKFTNEGGFEFDANLSTYASYVGDNLIIQVSGFDPEGNVWNVIINTTADGTGDYVLDNDEDNLLIMIITGYQTYITKEGYKITMNLTRLDDPVQTLNEGMVIGSFEGEIVDKDNASSTQKMLNGEFSVSLGI